MNTLKYDAAPPLYAVLSNGEVIRGEMTPPCPVIESELLKLLRPRRGVLPGFAEVTWRLRSRPGRAKLRFRSGTELIAQATVVIGTKLPAEVVWLETCEEIGEPRLAITGPSPTDSTWAVMVTPPSISLRGQMLAGAVHKFLQRVAPVIINRFAVREQAVNRKW